MERKMTDKVRGVVVKADEDNIDGKRFILAYVDPRPTHFLVPVDGCEKWKAPHEEDGFLVVKIPIKDCPACGGSGEVHWTGEITEDDRPWGVH